MLKRLVSGFGAVGQTISSRVSLRTLSRVGLSYGWTLSPKQQNESDSRLAELGLGPGGAHSRSPWKALLVPYSFLSAICLISALGGAGPLLISPPLMKLRLKRLGIW